LLLDLETDAGKVHVHGAGTRVVAANDDLVGTQSL
jgi:hypothetical protein